MVDKFASLAPSLKRTLADDIVIRLRNAIASGHLAPGERLQEDKLAEALNVSRGPVREALSQLEREGLVVKQLNRGTFVARLSLEDLDEVYSLRLAVERLAVQRAIQKGDDAAFAAMQEAIDKFGRAVDRGITEQEAAELDIEFHDLLYRASGHRRLYECWSNLRPQIHIFLLTRNIANPDFRLYAVSSHQNILDALRERDEPRAILLLEEHLMFAYQRVLTSYSE